ncbi:MAG: gamma-glutamyltransferase [Acidobacteriota bacterium]
MRRKRIFNILVVAPVAMFAVLAGIVLSVSCSDAADVPGTATGQLAEGESWGRTNRPVIRGKHHAVSSMKPEATLVAERILRSGGNAFDAAVAAQAVLSVVDPALNGVGADAMILIYDSRSDQVLSVNATGRAPKMATIEWYKENQGGNIPDSDGLLSATQPGVVDAWYILLDRWGTMTLEEVLAPAIELAEQGFPIGGRLANWIADSEKLRKYPTSVKVYYPDGRSPKEGEIFRNPTLARTLKKLVQAERQNRGSGRHAALRAARDRFYKGDIAKVMARFSEEQGGLFLYEDFASYEATVEEPVFTTYRGYQLFKNPSNNQGPAELIMLNMLEGYDLKAMGHNSPEYIHTSVEAVKLAFADRDQHLGDMDFIRIPFEGLLSKDYARERRRLIDSGRASQEFRPGVPENFMAGMQPANRPIDIDWIERGDHAGDTSYVCVVDKDRNVVSFIPSLHDRFGTGLVMADLGFILNCRGDYFSLVSGHANVLEPGRRPRSTLTSTLILRDGRPAMVMGSPGGDDQCQRTLQTFLNIVEFGMNVQQAIEAPRWSTRSFPSSVFPHSMYPGDLALEERIPEAVRESLREKGHDLRVVEPWSLGHNAAIVIDPATGLLSAGADPRVDAYALAW